MALAQSAPKYYMLINPFTPTQIAANPNQFFGRQAELDDADTAIKNGSVLIQGGVGIGKSSLLAQVRLRIEGFQTPEIGETVCVVGTKEITSVDDLARSILDLFVEIDESSNAFRFKIGGLAEYENREVVNNFTEGRHLATLQRVLTREFLRGFSEENRLLVIAIDEADKCPVAIARLLRAVSTHVQQEHIEGIRFVIAGVNPYFKLMLDEDEGVQRFFYKRIDLRPMPLTEAQELFEAKLDIVTRDARTRDLQIEINPDVIGLVVALSGGHPHVLQLLGSHIIDHENDCNDGMIDKNDMMEALRTVCYEDRGYVYDRLLHSLQASGHLNVLKQILHMSDRSFPTRVSRDEAARLPSDALQWLTDHNILLVVNDNEYGLVDEFLRVRMLLDSVGENPRDMSNRILSFSTLEYYPTSSEIQRRDQDYYEDVSRDFARRYRDQRTNDPFED
jgi:hypothetical protein